MHTFTVEELARQVAGEVQGDPARRVSGVAAVERAGPDDLTFAVDERYVRLLDAVDAGAALVPPDLEVAVNGDTTLIRVADPELAFSRLVPLFHPRPEPVPGVHPTARLGTGVRLGDGVAIGPYATIEPEAEVGPGTVIGAHTHVGDRARIGRDCWIAPNCTILHGVRIGDRVRLHPGVRVGVDGFGYAHDGEGLSKIPQVGGLRIGDDVEIGANSTVDRGSLGDTVIGSGTKIDNLVHIGHNVVLGRDCVVVAQVGVAGSVRIGDRVQLAGQAGIAGHLEIGDGARIAAQAGVIGDVPSGAAYSGYPARPHRESLRASAAVLKLPELVRRLRRLERRVADEED